jgi:hypothetical protein
MLIVSYKNSFLTSTNTPFSIVPVHSLFDTAISHPQYGFPLCTAHDQAAQISCSSRRCRRHPRSPTMAHSTRRRAQISQFLNLEPTLPPFLLVPRHSRPLLRLPDLALLMPRTRVPLPTSRLLWPLQPACTGDRELRTSHQSAHSRRDMGGNHV